MEEERMSGPQDVDAELPEISAQRSLSTFSLPPVLPRPSHLFDLSEPRALNVSLEFREATAQSPMPRMFPGDSGVEIIGGKWSISGGDTKNDQPTKEDLERQSLTGTGSWTPCKTTLVADESSNSLRRPLPPLWQQLPDYIYQGRTGTSSELPGLFSTPTPSLEIRQYEYLSVVRTDTGSESSNSISYPPPFRHPNSGFSMLPNDYPDSEHLPPWPVPLPSLVIEHEDEFHEDEFHEDKFSRAYAAHDPSQEEIFKFFHCGCASSGRRDYNLEIYESEHSIFETFPCSFCGGTFSRNDNLKRHLDAKGCDVKQDHKKKYMDKSLNIIRPASNTNSSNISDTTGDLTKEARNTPDLSGRFDASQLPLRQAARILLQLEKSGGFQGLAKDNSVLDSNQGALHSSTRQDNPQKTISDVKSEPPFNDRECEGSPETAFSQTPVSEVSSVATENDVDERKRQLIDRVVLHVTSWLQSRFLVAHQVAGESSSTYSSSGTYTATQGQDTGSGKQNVALKRKVGDRDTDDNGEDNGDTDQNPRPTKSRSAKGKEVECIKFACPYFKYNSAKYKDWRGCPGPGWPDVHRVKEHLYRRHRQPKHRCGRCWQPFADEQSYIEHQRNIDPCPLLPAEPIEGFDAGQEARLKSRKKPAMELNELEKWKAVFRVLFPHVEDIPSPFYDYDSQNTKPNAWSSLTECEEYVLREVPPRLRQVLGPELDRDLSIVEEGLKQKATDCIKGLLVEAFREFRQMSESSQAQMPNTSGQAGPSHVLSNSDQQQAATTTPANLFQIDGSSTAELPNFDLSGQDMVDFDLYGFFSDPGLTNSTIPFGEMSIIESLMEPAAKGGEKRSSDSGYESNNLEETRRDLSES